MAGTETITLRLVAQDLMSGNVTKAIGGLDRLARQGGLVGNVLQGVGMSMGQMLNPAGMVASAIGTVADVMGESIGLASDFAEQQSKVQAVFGSSAGEIERFAKTAATNLRMSERQALTFLGTMGNLFDALGTDAKSTVEMSKGLAQLAADLASFNNADVQEVMVALQSGLVGETEPMRRFGANLSAARVEAEALRLGLAKTKAGITDAMKVTARYSLIMQDTANAHGDAAKTADGVAGSFAIVTAEFENLKTELGVALLPVVKDLALALKDMLGVLAPNDAAAKEWARNYNDMAKAAANGSDPIISLRDGVQALNDVLQPQVDEAADFAKSMSERAKAAGLSERAILDMFLALKDGAGLGSEGAKQAIRAYVDTLNYSERASKSYGSVLLSVLGPDGEVVQGVGAGTDDIVTDIGKLGIRMRTSMASWKDEFVADWKDLAEAIRNPFTPKKLANLIDDYTEKAARNAARAARENKPNVARRWREVADVMKSPVLAGLVEIGLGVDDAVNAILLVRQMGQTLRGATSPLRDALGNLWGNSGGGGVNADGSPNRHAGGPVMAGRSYTVGGPGAEERLTMFPGGGGHVTPLQGGRGGGGTAVHVHFHGVVAAPSEADIDRMGRQLEPVIRRAMAGAA